MKVSRQRRILIAAISGCLVLAIGVLVSLLLTPPSRGPRVVGGPLPRIERRDKEPERVVAKATPRAPDAPAPAAAGAAPGPPAGATAAGPAGAPPSPSAKSAEKGAPARVEGARGSVVRIDTKSGQIASGVIVSAEGYVLTNRAAVLDTPGGVSALDVKLAASGQVFRVNHIAVSVDELDLAVLALDTNGKGLPAAEFNSTDTVRAGDKVTIVNVPGEVKGSRTVEGGALVEMKDPISPASAGGPVFNAAGRVVCVVARPKGVDGHRFCLPVKEIISTLDQVPGVKITVPQ